MNKIIDTAIKKVETETCRKCGLCCFIQLNFNVEGRQFIPTPFTIEGATAKEKAYMSLQMCELFDQETRLCRDYDNRPESCRKYSCKGKPGPQMMDIVGARPTIIKP